MNKLEQAARQTFETWWEREGQEFLFALNTTTDDDIKLVAEIAWKNGAYCAEQAEQEPVATVKTLSMEDGVAPFHYIECNHLPEGTKLYTAPVRTKDLTDDEIVRVHGVFNNAVDFARAVITKFKEKNNANNNS